MISSDMEEVIGVSDRVAVMHEGRISGFLERDRVQRAERAAAGRRPASTLQRSWRHAAMLQEGSRPPRPDHRGRHRGRASSTRASCSPINLANTANLVGLFGIFSIGQAFVIITGGIELSVGSMIALLGVHLRRPASSTSTSTWLAAPLLDRRARRRLIGAGARLARSRRLQAAALRRDAVRPADLSRRRALLHRGRAPPASRFGQSFPTLEWLTTGRIAAACPHSLHRASSLVARSSCGWCCTARSSAAISSPSARTRRRRAIPASAPTASSWPPMSSAAA